MNRISPYANALSFVEAFPEPLMILSLTGEVLAFNSQAEELIDRPALHAGVSVEFSQLVHDDGPTVQETLSLWSGSSIPMPKRLSFMTSPDGAVLKRCDGWRWLSGENDYIVVRIFDGEMASKLGELTRTVDQLNAECAARRHAEENLRELLRQLNGQNTVRDLVISQASHDLRTPLNAILGMSEFMLEEPFGAIGTRYREYISDIVGSGKTLLEIVDKVLALTVDQSFHEEAEEKLCDLAACLDSCVRLVEPIADRRDIAIVVPEGLTLPRLRADQVLIKQILTNLIGNAVKHIPAGGRIRVLAEQETGGGISVSVSDNGPGIPEDKLQKIMEGPGRGAFVSDTGLGGVGLFLSSKAAQSIGADISISSSADGGVIASLHLPQDIVVKDRGVHA